MTERAIQVTLTLFDGDKPKRAATFITIAGTTNEASDFVERIVTVEDEPEEGWTWKTTKTEVLPYPLVIPTLEAIIPVL